MRHKTRTANANLGTAQLSELLTLQQASQLLKVHPNTLRNWEKAGVIPVVRVGPRRDRRFPKHGIHQFLPPAQYQPQTKSAAGSAPLTQAEDVPTVTEEELAAVEAAPAEVGSETPHVIVNVPPKWWPSRTTVAVFGIILIVVAILLAELGQTGEPTTFAIRRNPPQVLFGEDFEAYELDSLPRPTWNTFGVWKVVREDGQRFLRGEEGPDNPLGLLSHVYSGSSSWQDYKLKFNAKVVSGQKEVIALVDYLDERNYYEVKFSEHAATVTLVEGRKRTLLGTGEIAVNDLSTWQTFAIDLFGDDIDVIVAGDRVLGVANAALTVGKVGFAVVDQVVDFDHVQVVEITDETLRSR